MLSIFKRNKLDSKATVDAIEKLVYAELKPLGFKRFGRNLHRFVDGDISQVINFQISMHTRYLYVNIGVRVPECVEEWLGKPKEPKNFFYEYECNIRTRLGIIVDKEDSTYDLKKSPQKIAKDILKNMNLYVLPMFEALNSRDAILENIRKFPRYYGLMDGRYLLDEVLLYKNKGDIKKATELFNRYYDAEVIKYKDDEMFGEKTYLQKGCTLITKGQKITAEKDGYVTVLGGFFGHIEMLNSVAQKWGIEIENKLESEIKTEN